MTVTVNSHAPDHAAVEANTVLLAAHMMTSEGARMPSHTERPPTDLLVEIVIPVYNEERALRPCIEKLRAYLTATFPYKWQIRIADNASKDRTWEIAEELTHEYPEVRALHLEQKGRGRALRAAWLSSDADIVSYMDVDLSTGLNAFLPMIAAIAVGQSEVGTGSRLMHGARITRQFKRELTSRGYNALIKVALRNGFSDAQCGFKAMRRELAAELLPYVENQEWFFDSELLLLAEERNLRIIEIPVDWDEDLDSRVLIGKTAMEDIQGLMRVRKQRKERRNGTYVRKQLS